jgi:hypothetical protein
MTLTYDKARNWLATHEKAFNTGEWDPVMDDYADDCVLEVHVDGAVHQFAGHSEIRAALAMGSASGVQTNVGRVVVGGDVVAVQICDQSGATFMTSFWHIEKGRIARDVSIICRTST